MTFLKLELQYLICILKILQKILTKDLQATNKAILDELIDKEKPEST